VSEMLTWPLGSTPAFNPRTGRELQLSHITQAFLQNVRLISGDCTMAGCSSQSVPICGEPRLESHAQNLVLNLI
jgi:hypothetical protein